MQFDRMYQPELIASKDETRLMLRYVELDVDGKRMMATDGHRAVIVPCDPQGGDASGPLTSDALKAARKVRKGTPTIAANGSLVVTSIASGASTTYSRPDRLGCEFPPLDKVMPQGLISGTDAHLTCVVNARYLYELAVAMGSPEHVRITLSSDDRLAPIVVAPGDPTNGAIAVVMPMKL